MTPFRVWVREHIPKPVRRVFVRVVDTVAGHRGKHHVGGAP